MSIHDANRDHILTYADTLDCCMRLGSDKALITVLSCLVAELGISEKKIPDVGFVKLALAAGRTQEAK